MQFRAVAAAMGITYEHADRRPDASELLVDPCRAAGVRRRCEAIQHGVIVHQLCRPIWRAWMEQAVLEGALALPGSPRRPRDYLAAKWIPQGWQWVDPEKEFNAMLLAIRAGLLSRSEAISAFGYDAEDIDREIAADNQRADDLGLIFDSDPRHDQGGPAPTQPRSDHDHAAATVAVPKTPGQLTCLVHLASRLFGTPLAHRVPNST
jgi:lambda family phage portal protein